LFCFWDVIHGVRFEALQEAHFAAPPHVRAQWQQEGQ